MRQLNHHFHFDCSYPLPHQHCCIVALKENLALQANSSCRPHLTLHLDNNSSLMMLPTKTTLLASSTIPIILLLAPTIKIAILQEAIWLHWHPCIHVTWLDDLIPQASLYSPSPSLLIRSQTPIPQSSDQNSTTAPTLTKLAIVDAPQHQSCHEVYFLTCMYVAPIRFYSNDPLATPPNPQCTYGRSQSTIPPMGSCNTTSSGNQHHNPQHKCSILWLNYNMTTLKHII